ncbi:MAG: RDD family protein [Cyclobacteriaceae bacterium]
MMNTKARKHQQFDLSHLQVDEKLQGVKLASFPRRALAYGLDWLIILLCTEFFALLLPLVLVFLIVRKRLSTTIVKSRRMLKKNVSFADRKLEAMQIDEKLRAKFRKHMTVYLYVIIYFPLLLAVLIVAAFTVSLTDVNSYETAKASIIGSLSGFFRPISDMNDAAGLLVSFLGAFVYFTFFNWQWQGSSPGKRLMNIRIVRLNGKPLTFWNSLERATGYTASASLLGYGFFQYFWDRNCQATHDKITETIVVEN